jgi:hypothetical protein
MPIYDTKPLEAYLATLGLTRFKNVFQFNVPLLGYNGLSKDVKGNSYWEVDTSSWDEEVTREFENGNVILNHAFHPIYLVMPKSQFEKYLKHPQTVIFKDFDGWYKIERQIEETYQDRSEKIEESGTLAPGYIFSTGVADGYAKYIVTKVTKASVYFEHLHFGDGYRDMTIESFGGKMSRSQFDRISFFGQESLWLTP